MLARLEKVFVNPPELPKLYFASPVAPVMFVLSTDEFSFRLLNGFILNLYYLSIIFYSNKKSESFYLGSRGCYLGSRRCYLGSRGYYLGSMGLLLRVLGLLLRV